MCKTRVSYLPQNWTRMLMAGRAPSSKAWESFSSALKNHLEGLETVERSGVSEPSTISETTFTTESATNTTAGDDTTESAAITSAGGGGDDEVKSKPSAQLSPVPGSVRDKINSFRQRFNAIRDSTIHCLERSYQSSVASIVFIVASIIGIRVAQSEVESSFEKYEKNVSKLFNFLDYYWNYYSYDILNELIEKLAAKERCFEPVKKEMDTYGEDMKKFREETSMEQMLLEKELLAIEAVPPDAVEVFIEKDSVKTKTLEDLQEFRKAFSGFYMVNECAVLLKEIGDEVIVAWYIIPTDQQEDFLFEYVGDSERNIPKEVLLFCASEILEFVDFKVLQQELEKHGVPKSVYQMPAEEGSRPSFETTYEMLQRIGGVEGGTGAFYRSLRDTQDSVHDHKFVADKLENRAQGMLHQVITLPEGCGPLNIFHLRLGDISEQRSGPADSGGQGSGSSEANVPSYILPPSTFVAMGEEMLAKIPVSKPQIPEPITREKIYVLSSLARRPSSSEPGVKFVQCSLHSELSHVYTGIETEICWKDAGIGLFLPKVELEKEINFTVKVVNDDYELPLEYRNMPLVSAMCQITASDKLPQPVRVRMQHCTAVENENVMGFMVAHGEPPYRFSPLPGGVFPQGECYGEIELGKFSILSIIRRIFGPIECAVHVCYCADSSADFVVTKNLPLHVAAVKKEYEDAKLDQYIATCSSSSTGIAFEAPKMSTNGWSVEPQSKPFKISRRVIVNYEPGQVIPHIKLDIIWTGQGPQRKEKINISVDGAEGLESFKLTCEPLFPCSPQQLGSFTAQQQDRTSETQLADRPFPSKIEPRPSALDTPTLPLLQRFPTRSGHFINVIERISVKGHCLCIHLLNDKWGMVANNLELKHRCDPNRVTEAVLVRWLEKEPHTWVDLVTALREIELGALATEIEDNLCRSQQDRPTLPLLKRFPTQSGHTTNIVEGIRAKCRDLCTRLLRDDWGAVIKSMELEHRNNPCQIAETVFQRWLAEEPNASWAELVSALRSIGLGKLPRKIEKNLLPPSVEH